MIILENLKLLLMKRLKNKHLQLIMMMVSKIQVDFGRMTVELLKNLVLVLNTTEVTTNVPKIINSGEPFSNMKCILVLTNWYSLVRYGQSTLGMEKPSKLR
jgi:hypothetical protein